MDRPQHKAWPPGRPHDVEPTQVTLYDNLARHAAERPDHPAIRFYGAAISYAELNETVCRIAGYLQANGLTPGDRVGIFAQNCPQWMMAFYGIQRAGGVAVPINPMYRAEEVDHVLEDAGITTVFAARDLLFHLRDHPEIARISFGYEDMASAPDLPEALRSEATGTGLDWAEMLRDASMPGPYAREVGDMAILPYTSGSTGRGKGCVHTHRTVLHAARSIYDWFGITGDDVVLTVAPMFHVVGLQCGLNVPIAVGATSVILPRWDRQIAAGLIRDLGVTVWPTVPTMVIDLLNDPGLQPSDLASLRILFGGGSAMPEAVAHKLHDLTGLSFLEGYGMTETIAPTTANPPHKPLAQCGGLPVFNTDVAIVDPETLAPLPAGEVGEVLISGPQVMEGYWRNDAANAESFVTIDGQRFLRSGDLGRINDEGYLFLVDRIKRMINASGYKVWPSEVEAILYRHPQIEEACVIAAKDPYRGETVKALVVARRGDAPDPDEIRRWAHDQMAAYKVPRLFEFVDALPKSGSGKVLWRELQQAEDAKAAPEHVE